MVAKMKLPMGKKTGQIKLNKLLLGLLFFVLQIFELLNKIKTEGFGVLIKKG